MWGTAQLQQLVQMLEYLGFSPSGAAWGGGAMRPTSPQQYQLWWDTTLGGPGQLICAVEITPSVIWCNAAGVPV